MVTISNQQIKVTVIQNLLKLASRASHLLSEQKHHSTSAIRSVQVCESMTAAARASSQEGFIEIDGPQWAAYEKIESHGANVRRRARVSKSHKPVKHPDRANKHTSMGSQSLVAGHCPDPHIQGVGIAGL